LLEFPFVNGVLLLALAFFAHAQYGHILIISKDQPGIRSINRSATSQESRNGTNEDEHELQQYSHANGIPKESKTVEDKLLEYAY
jgi:hypothetical protein